MLSLGRLRLVTLSGVDSYRYEGKKSKHHDKCEGDDRVILSLVTLSGTDSYGYEGERLREQVKHHDKHEGDDRVTLR